MMVFASKTDELKATENSTIEFKSLRKVVGKQASLTDLAKTCVSFANAQGGTLVIGIEDKMSLPPADQKISDDEINKTISQLRSLTDSVGLVNPELFTADNGGQFFTIRVYPSMKTIATTSKGEVYIRVGDNSTPVKGEELTRLAQEKDAFQWELITRNITIQEIPASIVYKFVAEIRGSDRVSDFIKELSEIEILEYYKLVDKGVLTNLGVLWLGDFKQRSKLNYPITVQYIVYDENESKVRKVDWNLNQFNPKELILEIEQEAKELNYSFELPDGMFRKQIRHYAKDVIRELIVNAFVHKSFTISGDIFISLYTDRLEIKNPGGLPLGVTKNNILHQVQRRNPSQIDLFKALKLMENEGSGYDLIYEKLCLDGKLFPVIESDINYVKVTIYSNIIDNDILKVIDFIGSHYQLSQKEIITLGIVVREKKISGTELAKQLQLDDSERLRTWVVKLVDKKILVTEGKTKGTMYQVNPQLLASIDHDLKPSLRTIEPHALEALIIEDLKIHPKSSMKSIHSRIDDIDLSIVRKAVYSMVDTGVLQCEGANRYRAYSLANKK